MKRIAIAGGGITGLSTAYELSRPGNGASGGPEIDLYETAERPGGVIHTERQDGFVLDAGPDSLITFKPAALDLCRELGLGDELVPTLEEHAGVFLYSRGELRPLPYGGGTSPLEKVGAFLSTGLISWPGVLRVAADLLLPRGDPPEDESMGEFFERRLGREAVERLIDPLLAGIYSGDPYRLSIRSTFPRFQAMVRENRSLLASMLKSRPRGSSGSIFRAPRGGLGRMVDALLERLGDSVRVHTRCRVSGMERRGNGYALRAGDGSRKEYDGVVLATPAPVSAELLAGMAPELAERLNAIRYVSTATVFLAYDMADLAERPRGHGFLVPGCEGRQIVGATWVTNKYPDRTPDGGFLVRCYLGGDRSDVDLTAPDETIVEVCRTELGELAGLEARPRFSRVFRWLNSGPQYEVGHAARVAGIESALEAYPGLWLAGSAYRGVGVPDCVTDGRAAARRLSGQL